MIRRFDDSVKKQVWETLRALNDTWTRGDPADLDQYFHPNMVAITASDRERREGGPACIEGWSGFCRNATMHRWEELDPRIDVYGDTAIVTYYFDMSFTMGGQIIAMGGRDMFVFMREQGRWWAVADQFSPYPPASGQVA